MLKMEHNGTTLATRLVSFSWKDSQLYLKTQESNTETHYLVLQLYKYDATTATNNETKNQKPALGWLLLSSNVVVSVAKTIQ